MASAGKNVLILSEKNPDISFVSRGGLKLQAAISHFKPLIEGMICADLGANVGGFTDCLLQNGASRVYSVDTAYGEFAWRLRQDQRVIVLERTNAIHFSPRQRDHREKQIERDRKQRRKKNKKLPSLPDFEDVTGGVNLVVIDLGWTRQVRAIPAAFNWLTRQNSESRSIITLIKPHYEVNLNLLEGGVLSDEMAHETAERVSQEITLTECDLGRIDLVGMVVSPIRGSKEKATGNLEFLAYYEIR